MKGWESYTSTIQFEAYYYYIVYSKYPSYLKCQDVKVLEMKMQNKLSDKIDCQSQRLI